MTNEDVTEYRRLEELDGSDYEIADGEPHVKGWDIRDNLNAKIGEVHDLLFNPASQKVRYLIADLEAKVFGIENRRILIPIGLAELHETANEVYLPGIAISQLAAAPSYYKGELTAENEILTRQTLDDTDVYDEQTFYEHDHYNERNFYGRRFTRK